MATAGFFVWYFVLFGIVGTAQAVEVLQNPLKFDRLDQLVAAVLQIVVMVSLPIISLIIVYSGFLFLTAQGNPKKLEGARNNIMYALIGAILVLGAWALAELLANTIEQLR
jgi:hypothetical protein